MARPRLVRGFERMDVGDALRVRLVAVDPALGFIDFERAWRAGSAPPGPDRAQQAEQHGQ